MQRKDIKEADSETLSGTTGAVPTNKHKQNVTFHVAITVGTFDIYLNIQFYHCSDHCWK